MKKTILFKCKGRGFRDKRNVLKAPESVTMELNKRPGSKNISTSVDCRFNTGGHGQRCKASHPHIDKIGNGVSCPFSFDYPSAAENPKWRIPPGFKRLVKEFFNKQ